MDYLSLLSKSTFVDNMIFACYPGMCSYLAVPKDVKTPLGLGLVATFILTCTLPINYLLETYILKAGVLSWLGTEFASIDLNFLSLVAFIAAVASSAQLVEMVVERYSPSLYNSPGIFPPFVAVNCAILGGSLFMQQRDFINTGMATVYGLDFGIDWMLAIVGLAAIREQLAYSNIPKLLRGFGITLIVTGLMGIVFLSFSGVKF